MELPKNITQIGETDKSCKIYVEDYVMSYMKQMNRFAEDKEIAVALYGRKSTEQTLTYCFAYGACKLDFLQKTVRHLSQAQNQEIERLRKKYFSACEFIGYIVLNGEMIEGVHIADQNGCRFVKGYACFYEKNDPMLAYMLDNRVEEAAPEKVSLEKYEEVKKRQEERRQEYVSERNGIYTNEAEQRIVEESPQVKRSRLPDELTQTVKERKVSEHTDTEVENRMKGMRFAAASVFVLLCLVSVVTLQTDGLGEEVGSKVKNLFAQIGVETRTEGETLQAMSDDTINTLVAEEQLTEAIRQENNQQGITVMETPVPEEKPMVTEAPAETATPSPTEVPTPVPTPMVTATPTQAPTPVPTLEPTAVPVQKTFQTYIIRSGDTLIGICMSLYGSETYVDTICKLNNISNPDNIQVGQKILLP